MRFIKVGTTTVCIAELQPGMLRQIITHKRLYDAREASFCKARYLAYTSRSGKLLDVYEIGEDLPYRRDEDQRVQDLTAMDPETFDKLFPSSIKLLWVVRLRHHVTDHVLIEEIRKIAHL
jgi:hypothetical protein